MLYRLSSSLSDRLNFDQMAYKEGCEAAECLDLEDMKEIDPGELGEEYWNVYLAIDHVVDINSINDLDYPVMVDDIEEAKVRWLSGFKKGLIDIRSEKLQDKEEKGLDNF